MHGVDNPTSDPIMPAPVANLAIEYFTDALGGTVVPAQYLNMVMVELLKIVTDIGGATPDATNANWNQLYQALLGAAAAKADIGNMVAAVNTVWTRLVLAAQDGQASAANSAVIACNHGHTTGANSVVESSGEGTVVPTASGVCSHVQASIDGLASGSPSVISATKGDAAGKYAKASGVCAAVQACLANAAFDAEATGAQSSALASVSPLASGAQSHVAAAKSSATHRVKARGVQTAAIACEATTADCDVTAAASNAAAAASKNATVIGAQALAGATDAVVVGGTNSAIIASKAAAGACSTAGTEDFIGGATNGVATANNCGVLHSNLVTAGANNSGVYASKAGAGINCRTTDGGLGHECAAVIAANAATHDVDATGDQSAVIASRGEGAPTQATGSESFVAGCLNSVASGAQAVCLGSANAAASGGQSLCAATSAGAAATASQSAVLSSLGGTGIPSATAQAAMVVASDASGGNVTNNVPFSIAGGQGSLGAPGEMTWRIQSATGLGFADAGWAGGAADFAEFFENEKRGVIEPQLILTRRGRKVRVAQPGDRMLGVLSAHPQFIGNDDGLNNTKNPRRSRPAEWSMVGLLGQLPVRIDATVRTDDFVCPGQDGLGTNAGRVETRLECLEITTPYDSSKGYGVALCLLR